MKQTLMSLIRKLEQKQSEVVNHSQYTEGKINGLNIAIRELYSELGGNITMDDVRDQERRLMEIKRWRELNEK